MNKKRLKLLSLVMALTLIFSIFAGMGPVELAKAAVSNHVVISEIYGGGGNSGAPYNNDFIELYNPTDSDVSLAGWSLQYASYNGTSWSVNNLSGVIKSHSYYLWQGAAGTGTPGPLPTTPDITGTINLSGTAGKVALVNSTTALTGTGISSSSVVDFVGFGTTASAFEGSGYAPAPSNTTSIQRKDNSGIDPTSIGNDNGNGWDTDDNKNDFVISNPIRVPKNSAGSTPTIVNVTGVSLDKTSLSLGIDQTYQLIATVTPSNATNKNVSWSSDNNAVATVTNGTVRGISKGTATITATTEDGAKTSLCVITVSANAPPANKIFDIVEITDFHGQLFDSTNTKPVGAALAKVVKDVRYANPTRTLILGGGDLYQGTPVSNVLHGVPVQKVMSNIGMEATALGNHEFDWGLNVINSETMAGANYSIVCANMYNKGTNVRPYAPYKIINKDGVRIAVIGAILQDAPTIIMPALTAPFDFRDPATEINACAKDIRDNNLADIVLADIHDGGGSLNTIVNNLHGVDAVFGGHTHTSYDSVNKDADQKNVPTLNAAATGQGFIDLKITVDPSNKIVAFSPEGQNWKALNTTTSSPTDLECAQIANSANADLIPIFNEVIGHDDAAYTKDQVDSPYGESQLGNWMADVVKNYPASPADIGMVNNGGIRLSPIPSGDITVGTIFNLMPFDNTVCTTTMTGAQLRFILEQAVQDNGKGIQVSGIKVIYDATKPSYKPAAGATPEIPGQRITKIIREDNNQEIKDTDILKVNAPDFIATGGDTFTGFLVPAIVSSLVDSHYTVRDALMDDVRAKHKITVVMNNRLDNQAAIIDPVAMSIAEARTTTKKAVILTGTVSAVNGNNIFMQDDTAGICVYNSGGRTFSAKKGDKITVTGNLSVYSGLLEITPSSAANVVLISTGNTLTPKVVTVSNTTNAIQGQLVKISNLIIDNINTAGATMAHDSTGSINIYKMPSVQGLAVGNVVEVTAAVTCYGTTIELAVDNAADVVIDRTPPVITISGVEENKVYNSNVTPIITTDDNTAKVTEKLNGNAYNGETISAEGSYILEVAATDLGGNTSNKTVDFAIDKTVPVISITGVENDKFYNTDITPVISANEGVVTATLNGQLYNGEVITVEGNYELTVIATDIAGNSSKVIMKFTLDKTAPKININMVDGVSFERIGTFRIVNTAEDNGSGLDVLETTIDGSVVSNDYAVNLEKLNFGSHQMVVVAKDKASNVSKQEINFTITATIKTLQSLLQNYYDKGLIKNKGIFNSLLTKLNKENLVPFTNELLDQKGNGVNEDAANVLLEYVNWINQSK